MTAVEENTLAVTGRRVTAWQFAPVPAGGDWRAVPADAWRAVTVPHVAETGLEDVRRGGTVAYRTVLDGPAGAGVDELVFEGVSYRCVVVLDGTVVARHEGAWDPFVVELGEGTERPGQREVVVVVDLADFDERSPLHFRSVLLGFVPDTAGPFGGLWRPVVHRRRPVRHLGDVRVSVDQAGAAVEVRWAVRGEGDGPVVVEVRAPDGSTVATAVDHGNGGTLRLHCEGAERWSPAHPVLHRVSVQLLDADADLQDEVVHTVGFRSLRVEGRRILVGDEPVYLRGALHWGHYPELRAPSPDPARAREELELIRSLGFNAVKFCLFLPPQHYLDLCDELGLLVWQELPLWLPRDGGLLEERIRAQYPRLVDLVAHHPSVTLVSLGCELDATVPTPVLDWAYDLVRRHIPDVVVCANSGSGECFGGGADAKSDIDDYHFYADPHELDELITEFTRDARPLRPWLFGEYNDADTWRTVADVLEPGEVPAWASPDLAVNPLRSVHAGFASDQQVYRQAEIIAAEGYAAELDGLTELSHQQAHEVRKFVWELTRSHAAVSGYVVTVLRDVSTTTSGLLDDRGTLKFDPDQVAAVNTDVVLALRAPLRRRWHRGGDRVRVLDPYNATEGQDHSFGVVLANATGRAGAAQLEVRLEVGGEPVLTERRDVPLGAHDVRHLTDIRWCVPELGLERARAARLVATVTLDGETVVTNDWTTLVHPRPRGTGVLLHDPGGRLDGVAAVLGARLVRDAEEVRVAVDDGSPRVLVTTAWTDELRRLTGEMGLSTFVVDDGRSLAVTHGPFWRENVKRVHPGTWLRDAFPTSHAGAPLGAVASDGYVRRAEIRRVVGDHTPLLTRYDARTYAVGEYVFEWREGRGRTVWSTLRLTGGTGTQPRDVVDNPLALSVLDAFIRSAARRSAGPPA